MSNTEGAGAAQAKTGKNREVLDREAGRSATREAFNSKTRSPHNAAGGPNYKYQDPGGFNSDVESSGKS